MMSSRLNWNDGGTGSFGIASPASIAVASASISAGATMAASSSSSASLLSGAAVSGASSSIAAAASQPPLTIAWPSMSSLAHGHWITYVQDSKYTHTVWHQAQQSQKKVTSKGRGGGGRWDGDMSGCMNLTQLFSLVRTLLSSTQSTAGSDESVEEGDDHSSSQSSPAPASSSSAASGDGDASSSSVSTSTAADSTDDTPSSQLIDDTELQSTAFLLANSNNSHSRTTNNNNTSQQDADDAIASDSSSTSSQLLTSTSTFPIPPRLTDRWQKEVTDFNLDRSSFGGLYNKRLDVLKSLFYNFHRNEQTQLARELVDAQTPFTVNSGLSTGFGLQAPSAVQASNGGFGAPSKKVFGDSSSSNSVVMPKKAAAIFGTSGSVLLPSSTSTSVLETSTSSLSASLSSSSTSTLDSTSSASSTTAWSSISARDPTASDWVEQLPALLVQLQSFQPLELRKIREISRELSVWMTAASKRLSELKETKQISLALAAMIGIAIQSAQPALILAAIRALLSVPNTAVDGITPLLQQLAEHQNQLDISAPFTSALLFSHSQTLPSQAPVSAASPSSSAQPASFSGFGRSPSAGVSSAAGLATDGTYLYVHTRDGLEKIGSGYNGSVRGQRYAWKNDYRNSEFVRVCCVKDKLYCMSSRMAWPRCEVLLTSDLQSTGFVQLGVDPEFSSPLLPGKSNVNPFHTDGKYLYLLHAEDVEETPDEQAAGEAMDSILQCLGEVEDIRHRTDMTASEIAQVKDELLTLVSTLHEAIDERMEQSYQESMLSPRRRTQQRKQQIAERKAALLAILQERHALKKEELKSVVEAKEQEKKSDATATAPTASSSSSMTSVDTPSKKGSKTDPSSAAPTAPATPSVGFTFGFATPLKQSNNLLTKIRELQTHTNQLLAHCKKTSASREKQAKVPIPNAKYEPNTQTNTYPVSDKAAKLLGLGGSAAPVASSSSSSSSAIAPAAVSALANEFQGFKFNSASADSAPSKSPAFLSSDSKSKSGAIASGVNADGTPIKQKKKFCKISMYIYDPSQLIPISSNYVGEDLFITQDLISTNGTSATRLAECDHRARLAHELSSAFAHAYSVRLCILALKKSRDDRNAACRWLLENGEEYRSLTCVPLKRSLNIANTQPQFTVDVLLQSVATYVTSEQLVIVAPPHLSPYTTDEKSYVRIISLDDGLLYEEYRGSSIGRSGMSGGGGNAVCYDAVNNLIWTGALGHSVSLTVYENHGPSPADLHRKLLPNEQVSKENIHAILPPDVGSLSASSYEIVLFLLAQMDRNLKHRDISSAAEPPVLETMRAQVMVLTNATEIARTEVDLLKRNQAASIDAASLLTALPGTGSSSLIDSSDASAASSADTKTPSRELETLVSSLVTSERTLLSSLVDRRNNPNRNPSAAIPTTTTARTQRRGALDEGSRTSAERIRETEERVTRMEAELATLTTMLAQYEAQLNVTSICPRAASQPFCITVDDDVFTQLHELMRATLDQQQQAASSSSSSSSSQSSSLLHQSSQYTLSVCLRLLQVHLELLLKHTAGSDTPQITYAKQVRTLLLELAMKKEDGEKEEEEKEEKKEKVAPSTAATPPSTSSFHSTAVSMSTLACNVLIAGLRIFYPTQTDRVTLLTELMRDFQTTEKQADVSSPAAGGKQTHAQKRKQQLLQGIIRWFSGQMGLADILLTSNSNKSKSSANANAATAVTTETDSFTPVNIGSFIRSLLDYTLSQEFLPFEAELHEKHRIATEQLAQKQAEKQAAKAAAATAVAAASAEKDGGKVVVDPNTPANVPPPGPSASQKAAVGGLLPVTPCLALLLVLEQDLLIQSGVLFQPSDVPAASPFPFGAAAGQTAFQQKAKALQKKLSKQVSASGRGVVTAVSGASSSDELPSSAPQLTSSDSATTSTSSSSSGPVWCGLSTSITDKDQPEVPIEVAAMEEESAALVASAVEQASTLNLQYFNMLIEYTYAVLDRCESLIDRITKDEIAAGGAKRPNSCVSALLRNSIFLLLPALLTSLGSPQSQSQYAIMSRLLPVLQSFLTKLDHLNSNVPLLRSEDAKFSRLLADENTKSYTFETPHPYPSGHRVLKQTLHIPGATHISWSFDSRCCTANGNDSLRFYSDSAMKQQIGGSYYGNERDSSASWPRTTLLTPGDTVTLCFSARAQQKRGGQDARVDNTNRYGFRCVARGVFIQALPWLLDVEHTVAGLMSRCIQRAIGVALITQQEASARPWFQYALMNSGLEESLQLSRNNSLLTPALSAASATSSFIIAPKSPPLAFLDRFILGSPDTKALFTEMDRHTTTFAGKTLLKRLSPVLQEQWSRAMRATMAAMIKHSGLTQDVYTVFSESASNTAATATPISARARELLLDRLKLISVSAKSLQNWMMEQVQAHNEWCEYFSPTRMTHTMEVKKKIASTISRQTSLTTSTLQSISERPKSSPAPSSASSSRRFGRSSRQIHDEDHGSEYSEEEEYEEQEADEHEHDDHEHEESADEISLRKDSISSAASSVPATPLQEAKEAEHKEREMEPIILEGLQEEKEEEVKEDSDKDGSSTTKSSTVEQPQLESTYTFKFSLNDLKEEYDGHPAKVRALCSIKRLRVRSMDATSNGAAIDMDDALSRVFAALERERKEKEAHARLYPTQAYHTLDPAVIKQNSYAIVIEQVYAMARALLCFKAGEQTSSLALTPSASSPIPVVTVTAAGSDSDIGPLSMPKLGRAVSELSHSPDSNLLPPVNSHASSLLSRTLSREVPLSSATTKVVPAEDRAEDLRSWLHTYSRWKSWQNTHTPLVLPSSNTKNSLTSSSHNTPSWSVKLASPLDVVKNLIRQNLDAKTLVRIAMQHQSRGVQRLDGFENLARALDVVSFEVGRVNLVGFLPSTLTMRVVPDAHSSAAASSESSFASIPPASEGIFTGIETANVALKAKIQESYEALLHVHLSLLKSTPTSSSKAAVSMVPLSPSSSSSSAASLFPDTPILPVRRNCYASRLLALADIFSLPFAPLPVGGVSQSRDRSTVTSPVPTSPHATTSSSLLPSSRSLFSLLTDALSVKRYFRRLAPSLASEAAGAEQSLLALLMREAASEKEEQDLRQQQEELAKQIAEQKEKKAAAEKAEAEAKAAAVAAAAKAKQEAIERKNAAKAAASAGASGSAAAAAPSASPEPSGNEEEDVLLMGFNLFDSDVEDDHVSVAQPVIQRSVSDAERERRVAEEKQRAEQRYLNKINKQFGDQPDDGSGKAPRKKGSKSFDDEDDDGSGAGSGGASGYMSVVMNRHGQKKSKWMSGQETAKEAREREREALKEERRRQREEAEANGEDYRDDGADDADEPEDDVPSDEISTSGLGIVAMPTSVELNSAFAARQWAALRIALTHLLQWSEPRVRAEMVNESESAKMSVIQDLRSLRSSVLRQLTRELVAALGLARTLAAQNHSWSIRSQLLELLEQLLTYFLYISPVAFDVQSNITSSNALGLTLLEIIQEANGLTPRITLLALRLARRVIPELDPQLLWKNFTAQQQQQQSTASDQVGSSVAARTPIVGESLSQWLVHRIGALLTAESLSAAKAAQALETQKRQQKRIELEQAEEAKRKKMMLAALAAAAAKDTDEDASAEKKQPESKQPESKQQESKESESKSPESALSPSPSSTSRFPAKTHALIVHYHEGLTTDKLTQILTLPDFLELAYGVRGVLPPRPEDVKANAAAEYERRQKHRRGPAKVTCTPKSGSLDVQAENRISSKSGFSTFVANVGVTSGKWYYQVVLATRGLLQIGWCTGSHDPSSADGQGVGDDQLSWAYDGMRLRKWHGEQQPYSNTRWQQGQIVSCLLDLDTPGGEMSFMLDGEHHGVAYRGFYTPELGPLYPAASISTNESGTWIFDHAKMQRKGTMRSRVPDGYSTLEGDRLTFSDPVPMRRAAEITRATDYAGHFSLIEADFEFCDRMAQKLASEHGITATVQSVEQLDSLSLTDASSPNVEVVARTGPSAYPKQVATGQVTHAFVSELVAFCRFLLDQSKSNEAWTSQMTTTLRQSLQSSPTLLASEDTFTSQSSLTNTLLGSLCVVGGFIESVRVGGLVRVATGGGESVAGATARGLVVQCNETTLRAVYLTELLASSSLNASNVSSHKLPVSQVVAVPELTINLAQFPLDGPIFSALQAMIETPLPGRTDTSTTPTAVVTASSSASSSSAPAPTLTLPSSSNKSPRSLYRWLLGELKWRSVAVLESLLTVSSSPSSLAMPRASRNTSNPSSTILSLPLASTTDSMFLRIGQLLVSHARSCQLELKLEMISQRVQEYEREAWNLRNNVQAFVSARPYQRGKGVSSQPGAAASAPNPNSFETVYSSSSFTESKIQAPVADDALLRYWDKHIIPNVQNYVRGSFRPFEMEMYMAQLRQPLRQNNQPAAIEIALTLTGGHIPDGMIFPDANHDFHTLALDDVRIGAGYYVSHAAASCDMWLPCMQHILHQVGCAKAVHSGEELVLLQFYDTQHAILSEYWLPVEVLNVAPASARNAQLSVERDYEEVLTKFEATQSHLSSLIARRAIFTLISRGGASADEFLQHELQTHGLDSLLEWIFLSVSESLELSDLTKLGEASTHSRESLLAFTNNLIAFLNHQRTHGGGSASASSSSTSSSSSLTSMQICNHILNYFKRYISEAATFSKSKAKTASFTLQPPAVANAAAGGSGIPPPSDAGDMWLHLKVEHASALIIMYSKDTRLSKGSMLSVHPDPTASELIKSYAGREGESPILTPLVASGSECYMHITPPQEIPARSSMKILPISSFLPLAFWLVELLLNTNTNLSESATTSSSVPSSASSTSASSSVGVSGSWSEGYEDGGLIGLCYTLCEIILENYSLEEISPSPLKEALLKIVSKLLTRITMAKHTSSSASNTPHALSKPGMVRQESSKVVKSQAKSLAILRGLHSEMVSLYALESTNQVFTSYLQQLVDLLAASDELRPQQDRLCSKFQFRASLTEDEKKAAAEEAAAAAKVAEAASSTYVCATCTYENPMSQPSCEMCGTPKPKVMPKKASADSSSSSSNDSGKMFHDVSSLVAAMRLLIGETQPDESPAVMAMMECCYQELKRDKVEQRLVMIENIPQGDKTLVASALAKALRQIDGTIRIDPSQIFIGTDPTKDPIKEPTPKASETSGSSSSRKGQGKASASSSASSNLSKHTNETFTFKSSGDENGVLYHIGALEKELKGESKWVNPATTSSVIVTTSSTDSVSDPVSVVTSREPKRFSTKNQTKQWINIEFVGWTLAPKKYVLRHAETSKSEALRNWKLEGSVDGRRWFLLDEKKADGTLSTKSGYAAFDVRSNVQTKEAFTHFRLTATGANSGSNNNLVLGNIEFYGTFKKAAEKPVPYATPYYALVQLNSAAMADNGAIAATSKGAAAGSAVSPQKALLDAISQITMPLTIKAPVLKKEPSATAISSTEAPAAATAVAAVVPEPVAEVAASSPVAAAASSSSPAEESKSSVAEPKSAAAAGGKGGKVQAAIATLSNKDKRRSGGQQQQQQQKGGKGGKDKAAEQQRENEIAARQRASEERRKKLEEERREKIQKEKDEVAAREEASRHVLLSAKPFLTLPNRNKYPVSNAYIRSRLVVSVEAEMKPPNVAQPNKVAVKSWGRYAPSPEFAHCVNELISRHAGPVENTPSLSGQPALDANSLPGFLAYAKLDSNPTLEKEVALMRKQASLPTGLEADLVIQILCRIIGAPAVHIVNPIAAPEPSLSLQPTPSTSTNTAALTSKILPPPPEYEGGASLVVEWLEDAGYDLNLIKHVESRFEFSIPYQQPSYWLANGSAAGGGNQLVMPRDDEFQPVDSEKFVEVLHEIAERVGEKDLLTLQPTQIILDESDWGRITVQQHQSTSSSDPAGTSAQSVSHRHHLPLSSLRFRYAFLRMFNRLFSNLLPLIDLRRTHDQRSIAGLVGRCRPFLFPSVKHTFINAILDTTAEVSESTKTPQISVNRLALHLARNRGESLDFYADSLLAKTYTQIIKIDPFHLRTLLPQLPFEVKFRGEQVVGEGGPFRQLFNDLGKELMEHSAAVNSLFQPTPNNLNKIGNDRDKYIIKPNSTTSQQIQLYEYIGLLFGICMRASVRFPLDLSSIVWKQLLEQELTLQDLYRIDQASMDSLRFIETTTDNEALDSIQQTFTTKLSDGSIVELKADGDSVRVNLDNKLEYIGLVIAARCTEAQAQIDAIRRGMSRLIPIQLLNLLTPTDLELLICGRNSIDIDLLRRHTKYSGIDPNAPCIEMFWSVLNDFDQSQRKLFVKFAYAQERLPIDDAEFIRTHTRFLIKPSNYANADLALPRSDTCFFNFELPSYSSIEIMRAKLLYAIHSDSSMNADDKIIRDSEDANGRNNGRRRDVEVDDF